MREIEGYLSIGSTGNLNVLYGPGSGVERRVFQPFQTNGLSPFSSHQEAMSAKEEIGKEIKDFKSLRVAKIKLSIAQNREDLNAFKELQRFVVVVDRGFDQLLIGRIVDGKPYFDIGAPFQANGLKAIEGLEETLWMTSEATRKGYGTATLAHILFEEVTE